MKVVWWPIHADRPLQRIHVDYAGPFRNCMFFVAVDAYSKWPEVYITKTSTSDLTIDFMSNIFSRFGLAECIVSDNGATFTSSAFADFTKSNGIKHVFSAPFHPSTNGQAERFVQTLKRSLKHSHSSTSIQRHLDDFLMTYRNTPHSATGETPANLFLKRNLKTRLSLLKPDINEKVRSQQTYQVLRRENHATRNTTFNVGETVYARDYRQSKPTWTPGKIIERTGPLSYRVETNENAIWRRHQDQIIERAQSSNKTAVHSSISDSQVLVLPKYHNSSD